MCGTKEPSVVGGSLLVYLLLLLVFVVVVILGLFCFVSVFQDRVSLCSLGCPGTHYVDQTDFEPTQIHLPHRL